MKPVSLLSSLAATRSVPLSNGGGSTRPLRPRNLVIRRSGDQGNSSSSSSSSGCSDDDGYAEKSRANAPHGRQERVGGVEKEDERRRLNDEERVGGRLEGEQETDGTTERKRARNTGWSTQPPGIAAKGGHDAGKKKPTTEVSSDARSDWKIPSPSLTEREPAAAEEEERGGGGGGDAYGGSDRDDDAADADEDDDSARRRSHRYEYVSRQVVSVCACDWSGMGAVGIGRMDAEWCRQWRIG
jgi:hypothetical protein